MNLLPSPPSLPPSSPPLSLCLLSLCSEWHFSSFCKSFRGSSVRALAALFSPQSSLLSMCFLQRFASLLHALWARALATATALTLPRYSLFVCVVVCCCSPLTLFYFVSRSFLFLNATDPLNGLCPALLHSTASTSLLSWLNWTGTTTPICMISARTPWWQMSKWFRKTKCSAKLTKIDHPKKRKGWCLSYSLGCGLLCDASLHRFQRALSPFSCVHAFCTSPIFFSNAGTWTY